MVKIKTTAIGVMIVSAVSFMIATPADTKISNESITGVVLDTYSPVIPASCEPETDRAVWSVSVLTPEKRIKHACVTEELARRYRSGDPFP